MMDPKVSVVIPTFNSAHYLAEAVESVLNQTYENLELLVVDDGSTDNTKDVVARFLRDPRFRYIFQNNQGCPAARNTGIKAARGEYIAHLDADDTILPTRIEQRSHLFDRHARVGVVFTDLFIHRDKEIPTTAAHYSDECNLMPALLSCAESVQGNEVVFNSKFFHTLVVKNMGAWPGNVMVRRQNDGTVELFNEHFAWTDIPEFTLRVCRKFPVGLIKEPLFNYNHYRSVLTKDPIEWMPCYIEILESVAKDLRGSPEWRHLARVFHERISSHQFGLGWHHFSRGNLSEARRHFADAIRFNKANFNGYLYLLMCLLPYKNLQRLRRLKHESKLLRKMGELIVGRGY